jgi:hypothetical protein
VVARFRRELRKYSESENATTWDEIKKYLDRLVEHIYQTKPAAWIRSYGIGRGPHYSDLVFFEVVLGGTKIRRYGIRRSLALAGLYAHACGDLNGVERAALLLDNQAAAWRSLVAKRSAASPRRRKEVRAHHHIRMEYNRLLRAGRPPRAIAGILAKKFKRSDRQIRRVMRRKADI